MFTSRFTKLAPLGFAVALLFLTVDGKSRSSKIEKLENDLAALSGKRNALFKKIDDPNLPQCDSFLVELEDLDRQITQTKEDIVHLKMQCGKCHGKGKIGYNMHLVSQCRVKCGECRGTGTTRCSVVLEEIRNLEPHLDILYEKRKALYKKKDDPNQECDSFELQEQDLHFRIQQLEALILPYKQELIKINEDFISFWQPQATKNRRLAEATQRIETKNNQNATLRAEREELIQARAQVVQTLESGSHNSELLGELKSLDAEIKTLGQRIEVLQKIEKLEMKLAALTKELIEKMCDPSLPLTSFELQDLRWQIIQTKEGIEHFKQELEELTSQARVTKNNQAPGPSRPHPVCPEPLMAE